MTIKKITLEVEAEFDTETREFGIGDDDIEVATKKYLEANPEWPTKKNAVVLASADGGRGGNVFIRVAPEGFAWLDLDTYAVFKEEELTLNRIIFEGEDDD